MPSNREGALQFTAHLAPHLLDPRGRSGRGDFLCVAVALFVLQLVLLAALRVLGSDVDGLLVLPLNVAICWMGYAAVSRRLHDLGRSAWWMPVAVGVWIAVGFCIALAVAIVAGAEALKPGGPGFWMVFVVLLAPPFAVALWLHLAEGENLANRYGPPRPGSDLMGAA